MFSNAELRMPTVDCGREKKGGGHRGQTYEAVFAMVFN
jgi:hypothetical protein